MDTSKPQCLLSSSPSQDLADTLAQVNGALCYLITFLLDQVHSEQPLPPDGCHLLMRRFARLSRTLFIAQLQVKRGAGNGQ